MRVIEADDLAALTARLTGRIEVILGIDQESVQAGSEIARADRLSDVADTTHQ